MFIEIEFACDTINIVYEDSLLFVIRWQFLLHLVNYIYGQFYKLFYNIYFKNI